MSDPRGAQPWPSVSMVVETSTWHRGGRIQLGDTLEALVRQEYPPERLETVIVVTPETASGWEAARRDLPGLTVVRAPAGLSYYQYRARGAAAASGELLAFLDADTVVPSDWAAELAGPFVRDRRIVAVQGRTRYRRAFLSRAWDAVVWSRAYGTEGPIDRIYGANNLALRRSVLEMAAYDDPNHHRGLWERAVTERLRPSGFIWLNPRARLVHDYHPSPARQAQLALARGYTLLAIRLKHPLRRDRLLCRWPRAAPWALFPGLLVKDAWRILCRTAGADLRPWEAWKAPLYVLAYLPFEVLVLAGMVLAARGRPAPRHP